MDRVHVSSAALNLLRQAVFDDHLRMLLTSAFTDVFLRLKHHVLGPTVSMMLKRTQRLDLTMLHVWSRY